MSDRDPKGIVTKLPQNWPKDLKALKSPDWGITNISDQEIPFDPGLPSIPFEDIKRSELWQQLFVQLKDVPLPDLVNDVGKSLIFSPNVSGNDYFSLAFGFPNKLETPRNFSISGDGTAPAVAFDGSQDVVLELTDVEAIKWKTGRRFELQGDASGFVDGVDGSQNVTIQVSVENAGHATTADSADFATNAQHATSADSATNANHASTADSATSAANATNANHATTADTATTATTATKVAQGSTTVTLIGDATGSGSADANGNININVTVAGSGGGGTGTDGGFVLGNIAQAWGRVAFDTANPSPINVTYQLPAGVEFNSASSYSLIISYDELSSAGNIVAALVPTIVRTTTGFSITVATADTDSVSGFVNFIAAGTRN